MEKLDGKSMDIVGQNIEQLKELFPEVFSEGKIKFDQLRELLGNYVVQDEDHYNFTWHGKRRAGRLAQTPSTGTLRPCKEESIDWDTTQNLFIEGDNLEVLKLLQKSYHRQVKMIYIDPPYNTGNDFVYRDDFKDGIKNYLEMTGQLDSEGKKMGTNSSAAGRYHTNWLNMMYPRLKLARNLLRDDGVIFISIDDDELANLNKICNEIYGEENHLGTILWKKKTNGNNVGYIPPVHDYILVYSKNAQANSLLGFPINDKFLEKTYSNTDNDPRGPWTTSDLSANHVGPHFQINNPNTGELYFPPKGRYWVFNEAEVLRRIEDGRIIFGKSGNAAPVQKKYLNERSSLRFKAESWWDNHGMNSDGTSEMAELFAPKIFDHPKPTSLLKNLVQISTEGSDLILDFFAGSATTADAIMQLSKEDEGKRKFVLIQLPEKIDEKSEAYKAEFKTIADLSKERIRRAAKKIQEENPDYKGDLGFKVFKLDSSNIKRWDASFDTLKQDLFNAVDYIKQDRSSEDVLYELLLKYGLDLTVPIETRTIAGKTVYSIGLGALVVCLDRDITMDVVKGIRALKDELQPEIMRVVFKDDGFKDDVVKTNALQTLKRYGIEDIKSL